MLKVSVPGNMVWMGEHAVLHQYPALGLAINQRMTVNLTSRSDRNISIHSQLGTHNTTLEMLESNPPFEFVMAAIQSYQSDLKNGLEITINSEFSSEIGFGSSAAVTIAMVAILHLHLYGTKLDNEALYLKSKRVVHQVQQCGSGLDLATSIYGGVVSFSSHPLHIKKIRLDLNHLKFIAVYCGFKTKTPFVIKKIEQLYLSNAKIFKNILKQIGQCVVQTEKSLSVLDCEFLGGMMNMHYGLLNSLGVSMPILEYIVYTLRENADIYGAKISGSGLGDCILALYHPSIDLLVMQQNLSKYNKAVKVYPIEVSQQGIIYG